MAAKGARVHIYGDWDGAGVKKAQQDLGMFERQATGFGGAMTKSMLGVGAAMGGAFAIGNLVGNAVQYLQDAAKAAMEDEKSVTQLATALGNLGLAHKQSGIEEFISQMQMATGVADTDLRKAYQRLVTATGDVTQSQGLLQTALDVSAAGYGDLTAAADALSKAAGGQLTALNRLTKGAIDPAIIKSKDFGAAIDDLNAKFGGQAGAAAETYAGKMARVQQAADEAQETIGYALLNAIDDVSEAFGGVGGMQDGITSAGNVIANFITGIGDVTASLAEAAAVALEASGAMGDGEGGVGDGFWKAAAGAAGFIPVLGQVTSAVIMLTQRGGELTAEQANSKLVVDALAGGYQMLLEKINPAAAATRDAGFAAEQAAEQVDELKAAQERLNTVLSAAEIQLNFQRWLRDLDGIVAKNTTSFDGWGKGVRKNQDALIDGFKLAEQQVNAWVKQGKVDADDFETTFADLAQDVVNQFVEDGFSLQDIKKFLKANGLWSKELAEQFKGENKQTVTDESRKMGTYVGRQMDAGIADGIGINSPIIQSAILEALTLAWNAAKNFLGIKSPSRLYMTMGEQTAQGYADGLTRSTGIVVTAAGALVAAGGKESQRIVRENVDAYMGIIEQAYAAIAQVAESVTSQVMGNVSLEEIFNEDGSFNPAATIEALFGSMQDQAMMVQTVASTIGAQLPPQLLSQILAMPPDAAIALANYLAANPEMIEQLKNMYKGLSLLTQTILGEPMGEAWAMVGDTSAAELLLAAQNYLSQHKKEFARWVRENITATVDVTVNYVVGNQPSFGGARAEGGPVSAGKTFLVGEKGPELLTMGASGGFVTPNDQIRSVAAGNTYSINVNAGVGDPRQIGQQVVEYIKRFEQSNTASWRAA